MALINLRGRYYYYLSLNMKKMSECFHNYRNAVMNYNLSSVRLEKISVVQTSAVKRVEKRYSHK